MYEYEREFFYTVIKVDEVKPNVNATTLDKWSSIGSNLVGYGTELGEFNPAQPIPYIVSLSAFGVLRIGWDRQLNIPE